MRLETRDWFSCERNCDRYTCCHLSGLQL